MKKYHGSRNQFSYVENEDFISPLEVVDKVSDDDFIVAINEIVSDRWLEKYNTDWLKKLRNELTIRELDLFQKEKDLLLSNLCLLGAKDKTLLLV